jgi:ATP-dependent Lon protease
MASGKMGLVGIWDAIGFDEVADLQKMPKEVVTTLKTYCESGTFARGKDSLSGMASIAMFGNTNQPVEVMVRSSHLFMPMPDVIREDMAFLDRIHFYIPGWEMPKMKVEFFTGPLRLRGGLSGRGPAGTTASTTSPKFSTATFRWART